MNYDTDERIRSISIKHIILTRSDGFVTDSSGQPRISRPSDQ